ncbi:hypothetical protein PINS_up008619 [Pythium insidiosum]|nr:hypothetical protein PINS_up008619 [Pythium insidiosum]
MQQWVSYLLWCKFNTVVDRIQNHERERYSEWMKIVLGADEPPPTQVSRRRETESLLPQPIQHTLRAVQYVLPPKSASHHQRHDSSSSKNESKSTGKKRQSSSSWLERKAAEVQNGASRLKIDIPAGQPRRRASVGTPTSPSPVFARNAARKRKRERDADVAPALSRRALLYSPDVKRGRAASLQSQSDGIDYSPSTVSAVSSAPGPRRGTSVPLCFDLTNDDHTSGTNRSMPVGWGPDDVQGVAPARRPAAMNPLWSMSLEDLKRHINAVRVEGRSKSYEKLSDVLSKLMTHPRNRHGVFNYPVDPVAQNLPTYLEVIKVRVCVRDREVGATLTDGV